METIKAIHNGSDRIMAVWEGSQSGELYSIAKEAARAVEYTGLAINRIVNDKRLSPEAKREDRKVAGLDSLKNLAKFAARIEILRKQIAIRANALAAVPPYRDGDAATPLIDMEIARKLGQMTDESARVVMLMTGEQPRLTEAVLRLPAFLSGLSDAESRLIAQEADDLNSAHGAVVKAFKLIAEATGAELIAQVAAAGEYASDLVRNLHPDTLQVMQSRLAGTFP
jgi:hypothetical protein